MKVFETSDFYLACFLRYVGFDLTELRREGKRCVFVFRDKKERQANIMDFYNNKTTIHPLSFIGTIKDMKSIIHNT